jgi:hypothetical protein
MHRECIPQSQATAGHGFPNPLLAHSAPLIKTGEIPCQRNFFRNLHFSCHIFFLPKIPRSLLNCIVLENLVMTPFPLSRFRVIALAPIFGLFSVPHSQAAVVLNQIGDPALYEFALLPPPSPSQIFTDFPAFNCTVLENFTVSSSELRVTQVSVLFRAQGGFISFQDVQGYQLNFFSDVNLAASTLVGDAGSIQIPAGPEVKVTQITDSSNTHEYGLVVLNVDVALPSAGNYWVGVSPVAASTVAGQFFVQTTTHGTSGSANARLANPEQGLGAGTLSTPGNHYAYSVTVIPEPGTLALWIIGSFGWLARRRRVLQT